MDEKVKANLRNCENIIPFLRVVSNVTRLKILCILSDGERRVGEIQEFLGAKQSYISQQLKYLKIRGYLNSRRDGTQIYYRLKEDTNFPDIIRAIKKLFA